VNYTAYLAGPMRDYFNFNFEAFENAAATLRAQGWKIVSPHEFDLDTGRVQAEYYTFGGVRKFVSVELSPTFDFEDTMGEDLRLIEEQCNALVLLPGWGNSEGANLELQHALKLGYPIFLYADGIITEMPVPDFGVV